MTVIFFHKFIMRYQNIHHLLSTLSCCLIFSFNNLAIANNPSEEELFPAVENADESLLDVNFLEKSLQLLNELDDNGNKVQILNNIALKYIQIGQPEKATEILEQSFNIILKLTDKNLQVSLLGDLSKYYQLMDNHQEADNILDQSFNIANTIQDPNLRATLIFEIALQYDLIGETKKAEDLFIQTQNLMAESRQKFPFREKPRNVQIGLSGSVSSFRDTTAFAGFNLDFYKQWQRHDYWFDGNFFLDYDSSRSINNFRPGGQIASLYRKHYDYEWSLFNFSFATVNNDLFAPKNDDEDITAIVETSVGASYNIWRGRDNQEFWDFQMGMGFRYEYDYIDFELIKNQLEPTIHFGLVGKSIRWGKTKVDQFFTVSTPFRNFNNYIIVSQTRLSIPITKRWSFANRLFIRYRNEKVLEDNPKLQFVFSTGFDYKF